MTPHALRPDWVELPLGDHLLGESPRWDAAARQLSWVDVLGATLTRARLGGAGWGDVCRLPIGRMPTAAEPLPDGAFAVAVDGGVCVVDGTGEVCRRLEVCPRHPGVRTNDMTVDAAGRLLVGLFTEDRVSPYGGVVAVDLVEATVRPLVEGYVTANGMAVTPDGEALYVVDTARGTLRRHRFDADPGDAGDLLVNDRGRGKLDGLTLGPDGHLWVAVWDAGVLHRYDPGGRLRQVVAVPVARPTAVALVEHAGRRELVITTASRDPQPPQGRQLPRGPAGAGGPDRAPGGRLYSTPLPE